MCGTLGGMASCCRPCRHVVLVTAYAWYWRHRQFTVGAFVIYFVSYVHSIQCSLIVHVLFLSTFIICVPMVPLTVAALG
jgi:hypothetical protein